MEWINYLFVIFYKYYFPCEVNIFFLYYFIYLKINVERNQQLNHYNSLMIFLCVVPIHFKT